MIVPENEFGAIFFARTAFGLGEDRDDLLARGFTILREDPRAGATKMIAHGPVESVMDYVSDFSIKLRIEAIFFPLPEGEDLTLDLILTWGPRQQVVI